MASLETGRRLAGRYVLKERLGDGGHAEVWAAGDGQSGECVALKFMHLRACSVEEALPVLRHEARMARFLDHPRVLRVEEPVRDGDTVFLPMEYAPGGGAAQLRGASWRRIVPVLIEVARVLEHAHARGIVHRDIKTGNVLFAADGTVRIADFGTSTETGSSDAPSTGSPFSASPQQLRGEGASPADDVYGLGALAHELLTRYPPFYPHFDARRVQEQDPPRPVPAQPAPVALLDLVQAMLSREAAVRPALGDIITTLEAMLESVGMAEEGATIVEAAPAAGAQPSRGPRGGQMWWWGLFAAGVAGVGLLLWLPEPGVETRFNDIDEAPAVPSVADALVGEPATSTEAAAPAATAGTQPVADGEDAAAAPTLADEVRAGEQALAAFRPAEASAAFRRALALQDDHVGAREGLAAAVRQQELLAQLAAGTRIEATGDLDAARAHYRQLLGAHPGFTPAEKALARVNGRLADLAFEQHVARAIEALQQGRVEAAEAAYADAAALRARDPRVVEGQQRLAEIHRDRQNAADLATGTGLESAERWEEAVAHYRSVLERESGLHFAQEGLARSERRLELDRELADYQARPERLTAPVVRQAAQRALARGSATAAESPRLVAQLDWLREQLALLSEPVRLELRSDNQTLVRVMQVGELGRFETHELDLPPGRYTVIGQREGFRDVRLELNLAPGQRDAALSVRCTERI